MASITGAVHFGVTNAPRVWEGIAISILLYRPGNTTADDVSRRSESNRTSFLSAKQTANRPVMLLVAGCMIDVVGQDYDSMASNLYKRTKQLSGSYTYDKQEHHTVNLSLPPR